MVMPRSKVNVIMEISQLKTKFSLLANVAATFHDVKVQVKLLKGVPIERQEILFMEKAMENNRRLYEYRVKNGSTLHVLIQVHFDLLIDVETFWGKTYRFYMDPCSTGRDVIRTVFSRTFSKYGTPDPGTHEYYLPLHALVLKFNNKIVMWDVCLGRLDLKSGDKIVLTTVSQQNGMPLQAVKVVTESGEKFIFAVSKYERWSAIAFSLHGMTNIPVDLMRIYMNNTRVDFLSVIGIIPSGASIFMNVVMSDANSDILFGVPLRVNIGNGIVENVQIAVNKTTRSVKKKLERQGVPNATMYELMINNQKLANTTRIQDLSYSSSSPLTLHLEKFPIFAHAPDGMIYKTYSHARQTIEEFRQKMQLKSGLSMGQSRLIVCGTEIKADDSVALYDAGIGIKSSVFIQPSYEAELFFIQGSDWVGKIKFPVNPTFSDIHDAVFNNKKIPMQCVDCLLTFLYWYFAPRLSDKYREKLQNWEQFPVSTDMLFPFHPNRLVGSLNSNRTKRSRKDPLTYSSINSHKSWSIPKQHENQGSRIRQTFEPSQFLQNGGPYHTQHLNP